MTRDARTTGDATIRPAAETDVFSGLITVSDVAQQRQFDEMVGAVRAKMPASGSDALALLRARFPHVPLASRVAAVEVAKRGL